MDLNVAESNTGAFRKHSTWPPVPPHEALRHSRRYVVDALYARIAEGITPGACPTGIDVLSVVCHLTANSRLAEANLTGRLPEPVVLRGRPGLTEVLAEWERSGAAVEDALVGAHGLTGSLLVMDVFTHELDIRRALGAEDPAYHPALATALDVAVNGAGAMVGLLGLPALRFETTGAAWEVGEGEPAVAVWAPPLELYRALIGRLPAGRIRALRWSDDPERWLPVFEWGPFRASDVPVARLRWGETACRV